MPYRILAVDGGGVRGIVPAIVLERLAAEPSLAGFLDRVDLLAGTSTGGLLALALAAGLPPTRIRALYAERARRVRRREARRPPAPRADHRVRPRQ